jgi:large subunit ribosomal protein L5
MNATETQKKTFDALKGSFGYTSTMQAPKVVKIVVSTGVGSIKDKKRLEFILGRLTRIVGQHPATRGAKKSIANFKIRTGDTAGYQATLRGKRGEDFLSKFINIVLPRVKDFRGLNPKAIDEMGNITIGLKEHTVFPETADEESKDIFGLAITITTTAKNKQEAEAFLRYLGLPLRQ